MKRLITLATAAAMLSAVAVPVVAQESPAQAEDPYLLKKKSQQAPMKGQGEAPARSETQGQNPEQKPPAAADAKPQPAPDGAAEQNKAQTDQQQDPSKQPSQTAEQPKPDVSQETTASINITAEQKTAIREVVFSESKPIDVDFQINVGVAVPRTVVLHTLPTRVVEIVPQYEGYRYFVLADGRIIIVEPDTLEIVYILVV
jgi:hypothetical protein